MADYILHFEDGSEGYLCHHGIKGQKWGVRRKFYVRKTNRAYSKASKYQKKIAKNRAKYRKVQNRVDTRRKTKLFRALRASQQARIDAWDATNSEARQHMTKPAKYVRGKLSDVVMRDRIKVNRIDNGFIWEQRSKWRYNKRINKAKKKLAKQRAKAQKYQAKSRMYS